MAASSGGDSFCFDISVIPTLKDKKGKQPLRHADIADDTSQALEKDSLQTHLIKTTKLKNFYIDEIRHIANSDEFVIQFSVLSETDFKSFKSSVNNNLPTGIKRYLDYNKCIINGLGKFYRRDNSSLDIVLDWDSQKTTKRASLHFQDGNRRHIEKRNDAEDQVATREPSDNAESVTEQKMVILGFYFMNEKDIKDFEVYLKSDIHPSLNGTKLQNTHGNNVWMAEFNVPQDIQYLHYTLCIGYTLPSDFTALRFSKQRFDDTIKTSHHVDDPFDIYGISPNSKEHATAWAELCFNLIASTTGLNVKRNVQLLYCFRKRWSFPKHLLAQVITVLQSRMETKVKEPLFCELFLLIIADFQDLIDIQLIHRDTVFYILHNCAKFPLTDLPLQTKAKLASVLFDMYISNYKSRGSFVEFISFVYPYINETLIADLLVAEIFKKKTLPVLNVELPMELDRAHNILLALVQRISDSHVEGGTDLLGKLLRHLPSSHGLRLIETILRFDDLPTECMDICQEIYILKINMEIQSTTDMRGLCSLWIELSESPRKSIGENTIDVMEKQLLKLMKIIPIGDLSRFQTVCSIHRDPYTLFPNRQRQIEFLKTLCSSENLELHRAFLSLIIDSKFSTVLESDSKTFFQTWLDTALKFHCGKRNQSETFIPKMYQYLGHALKSDFMKGQEELVDYAKGVVFLALKEFSMVDIVKRVKEVEKLEDDVTEEMYVEHVRELLQERHDGKTANCLIKDLAGAFGLRINSRVTLKICKTLVSISGVENHKKTSDNLRMIVEQADFWITIFQASGTKKEDLEKDILLITARQVIEDIKRDIKDKTITANVIHMYRNNQKAFEKLFRPSKGPIFSFHKTLEQYAKLIENTKEESQRAERLLQTIMKHLKQHAVNKDLSGILSLLLESQKELESSDFKVSDINDSAFRLWLRTNEVQIKGLPSVVRSPLFWNSVRYEQKLDTLEFVDAAVEYDAIEDIRCLFNDEGVPTFTAELRTTTALLEFLFVDCVQIFKSSWDKICKADVSVQYVQHHFKDTELDFEVKVAKECLVPVLSRDVENLRNLFRFKDHKGKITAMRRTLKAFHMDISSDPILAVAFGTFEDLYTQETEKLKLCEVYDAVHILNSVTKNISDEVSDVLLQLERSSELIKFLSEVLNDDIRNLIDAVEEHSEQFVRESTVSALIDVKRFLYPVLKEDFANDIQKFFSLLTQSISNSGIKGIPGKICDCMENVHSLRSLYLNVTNKGERTKEMIEQILLKGKFTICMENEMPDMFVEYTVSGKLIQHSQSRLNDLRSRALLIMNTNEKSTALAKKNKHLADFVLLIDSVLDICRIVKDLRQAGHFKFLVHKQTFKQQHADSVRTNLQKEFERWLHVLKQCREHYYFMNFIHSCQLQTLSEWLLGGKHENEILNTLKYINNTVSDSTLESMKNMFKEFGETVDVEKRLDYIGQTIQLQFEKMLTVSRQFQIKRQKKKLSDAVQEGKLFVVSEENNHLLLPTLMAIYLNTTQKLPESHQVLFCNNETTGDEMVLLINRCLVAHEHGSPQLFCIMNVELLPTELCFALVSKLHSLPTDVPYLLAVIIGANGRSILEEFSANIMPIRALTDNEMKDLFKAQWPDVITFTSDIPGLGKTETINELATLQCKSVKSFHISGPFMKSDLIKELSCCRLKPYHLLHVDVAVVDDPVALDLFLFELVVFGYISTGSASFGRSTDYICIEIANSVKNTLVDSLSVVNQFKQKCLRWNNYEDMKISQEINSPVQVVCHYLQSLKQNDTDRRDIYFTGPKQAPCLSETQCRNLLKQFFVTSSDMSFSLVNVFLNVLADQLKKMSASIYFRQANIVAMVGDKEIPLVKSRLLEALISVSKEFATRSVHTCRSTQLAVLTSTATKDGNHTSGCTTTDMAGILAKRVEGMIQWEDSNHLMVLFHQDIQTVSALFRDKSQVPKNIKDLFKSQMKKELEDMVKYSAEQLQTVLKKLTRKPEMAQDSGEFKNLQKTYALTPDNLLKMVLITQRVKANIPVIIMGETGCGKTSLVRFLAASSGINFEVLSIHAGVTRSKIVERVMKVHGQSINNLTSTFWLFLDEINTCDHLGIICDIICHHRCLGKRLAPNLVIIAACNPYRLRSVKAVFSAGLQNKVQMDELSRLVYRVHPLPETMVDFVWDYGRLGDADERRYIKRMVGNIMNDNILEQLFVDLLSASQLFVRNAEKTDYSVSLRDVERCKRLLVWFVETLQNKPPVWSTKPNVFINIKERAMILALSLCYHSRFPDANVRKEYRNKIADIFTSSQRYVSEDDIWNIIKDEHNDILDRMELPEGTAKNTALQENVFTILVCILNKIPIFVVGKPGCSKSLSMQLIRSNLRGKDSRDEFFKTLPQLFCVSFQGSESSTSDGIIKVFEKAKRYQDNNDAQDVLSVVILDEIGLAEVSRFNPLKVLHSLLEPEGKVCPDVSVVGISNWALDAAKMNRAIHLSRPEMDEKELHETGVSISLSLIKKKCENSIFHDGFDIDFVQKDMLRRLAQAYCQYVEKQTFQNFHGLRDFYSLIKHWSRYIVYKNIDATESDKTTHLTHGLLRNFGGLQTTEIRNMKEIFQNTVKITLDRDVPVDKLIKESISDAQCRHLLLIINGDAVISSLDQILKHEGKPFVTILGSRFEDDLTDDYNHRVLSRIILCMEQGMVLILKDLEVIYGSLYDMLNQNYTVVGNKKHCRVALGPYSNPMCYVHDAFKCIVLVESSKLDTSDPPFLNRFEKQQFRFGDLLMDGDSNIIMELASFMQNISSVQNPHFNVEHCFPIWTEDMLSSLVLSLRSFEVELSHGEVLELCYNHLMMIMFPDAVVRSRNSTFSSMFPSKAKQLRQHFFELPTHDGIRGFVSKVILEQLINSTCDIENTSAPSDGKQNYDLSIEQKQLLLKTESMFVVFTHSNIHLDIQKSLSNLPLQYQLEKIGVFKTEKSFSNRMQQFFESDNQLLILQLGNDRDMQHFQFAKSALENKFLEHSKTGFLNSSKFIIILIHVSKELSEDNLSLVHFMPNWTLFTIDELENHTVSLPILVEWSLPEAIENTYNLRDSIMQHLFWAYTRIQFPSSCSIKIIEDHIDSIKNSKEFVLVIGEFILSWINKDSCNTRVSWQMDVANNAQILNSTASFMAALFHWMQETIKTPLAIFIYRLEESGALESFLENDDKALSRRTVWKELYKHKVFFDYESTPLPSGPECYTCTTSVMRRRMPFSDVIFRITESLKDDYMETLQKVKLRCNLDEDELPRQLVDEMIIGYRDVVTANLPEISSVDYNGMLDDYFHDFCNIVTSTIVPGMKEDDRVQILQWIISNMSVARTDDLLSFLTNLHITYWTFSESANSLAAIFEVVLNIVEGISVPSIIEHINNGETSDKIQENKDQSIDSSSTADATEEMIPSCDIKPYDDISGNVCTEGNNVGTEEQDSNAFISDKAHYHDDQENDLCEKGIEGTTDHIDTHENTSDEVNRENTVKQYPKTPLDHNVQDGSSNMFGHFTPVSSLEIDVESGSEHSEDSNQQHTPEERAIAYFSELLLPSKHNLQQAGSVSCWRQNVSRFLPLVAAFSYDIEVVQALKFCYDFASVAISYDIPKENLSEMGELLLNDMSMFAEESFFTHIISVLGDSAVPPVKAQRIICLFINRCFAAKADSNVFLWILSSIENEELPDETLSYICQILRLAIEVELDEQENESSCLDFLQDDMPIALQSPILESLDLYVSTMPESCQTYNACTFYLVRVFEAVLTEDNTLNFLEIDSLESTLLQANNILKSKKMSLRYLVAIAFMRQYLEQFSTLDYESIIDEGYAAIMNTTHAVLESWHESGDPNLDDFVIYTLKCFGKHKRLSDIKRHCSSVSDHIPIFGNITWYAGQDTCPFDFNPLPMHYSTVYDQFQNAADAIEEKEEIFVNLAKDVPSTRNKLISIHALLLNRVFMKRAEQKITHSDEQFVRKVLKSVPHLPQLQRSTLEFLSGEKDFFIPSLVLTPDTPEPMVHIVSFLCHLLSVVTTFGCTGELFYNIITDPKGMKIHLMPGFERGHDEFEIVHDIFTCSCKTRFVSSDAKCPICKTSRRKIHENETSSMHLAFEQDEMELNVLRLIILGYYCLALAIHKNKDETVLMCLESLVREDNQDISDMILSKMKKDWEHLRLLTNLSHSDLCSLLHIFIIHNKELLTSETSHSHGHHSWRKEYEKHFANKVRILFINETSLLKKYKKESFAQRNMMASIECLLDEVTDSVSDDCLTRFLCITGTPTKENFRFQISIGRIAETESDQHPFLRLVLQRLAEISLPKHIVSLLRWHFTVVAYESYKIRRTDLRNLTFSKFLSRETDPKKRAVLAKSFDRFKSTWNDKLLVNDALRGMLLSENLETIELITMQSEVEKYLLVDSTSPLLQVLQILFRIHNKFLNSVLQISASPLFPEFSIISSGEESAFLKCVSVIDVREKDLIHFEWNDDYLRYSQCDSRKGRTRQVVYDFKKIEMEMFQDIVHGRSYITDVDSLPQLIFIDESFRNSLSLLKHVGEKIPQKTISNDIVKGLKSKKEHCPSHTVEMLTQIGIAVSLLNKTGGDPSEALIDYVDKWNGVLPKSVFKPLLPDPEHLVKLGHTVALYEYLEKVNGEDICENLGESFREELPTDCEQMLQSAKIKSLKFLETLWDALKVFVHRNVGSTESEIDCDQDLLFFLKDPVYWKHGTLSQGELVHGDISIPLDYISKVACVKHVYRIHTFIKEAVEDAEQKDVRITSITAGFASSHQTKTKSQTKTKKKQISRKFQGKT